MKSSLNRLRVIDGETVFTGILLVIAVYMFVEAATFSSRAATFPRAISGAAIVGCVLLLISPFLPGPIRSFVEEDARIVKQDDATAKADETPADSGPEEPELKPINSAYTALMIGGYVIVAYLAGFFVATPLFVLAYIFVFDINRLYGSMILIASVLVIAGLERALNAPLDEGLIFTVGF